MATDSANATLEPAAAAAGYLSDKGFIKRLIDLYRDAPVLWNVKSEGYMDKRQRSHAIMKILKKLQIYRPDFTDDDFKKKVNVLRTNFNKERNKLAKKWAVAAAGEGEDVYDVREPKLWYFTELEFLADQSKVPKRRESQSPPSQNQSFGIKRKCEPKVQEEQLIPIATTYLQEPDYDEDVGPKRRESEYHPTQSQSFRKKRKHEPKVQEEKSMPIATTYLQEPEYDEDVVAKYWTIKLRRLAPDQRTFAEKIISDVLFEGEMGTLTRNGISFIPTSPIASEPDDSN